MNRDAEAFGMLTGIGSPVFEVTRPYVDRIVVLEQMRTDLAELLQDAASQNGSDESVIGLVHLAMKIINRGDTP